MKTNSEIIEKIKKEFKKAFPKDFYLWSEYGFWLAKIEKALTLKDEQAKERMKELIEAIPMITCFPSGEACGICRICKGNKLIQQWQKEQRDKLTK
jgi:hypothetical protein